jgi:Papain family cysteine protease
MEIAFKYVISNGIVAESDYPYVSALKTCQFNKSQSMGNVLDYDFLAEDEEFIKQVLFAIKAPLSVAIDSNLDSFFLYSEGIYDDKNCTALPNHAV